MYEFKTVTGKIVINLDQCLKCSEKPCISACIPQILAEEEGRPVLAIDREAAQKGRCIECLACELECHFTGNKALQIHLPLPEAK